MKSLSDYVKRPGSNGGGPASSSPSEAGKSNSSTLTPPSGTPPDGNQPGATAGAPGTGIKDGPVPPPSLGNLFREMGQSILGEWKNAFSLLTTGALNPFFTGFLMVVGFLALLWVLFLFFVGGYFAILLLFLVSTFLYLRSLDRYALRWVKRDLETPQPTPEPEWLKSVLRWMGRKDVAPEAHPANKGYILHHAWWDCRMVFLDAYGSMQRLTHPILGWATNLAKVRNMAVRAFTFPLVLFVAFLAIVSLVLFFILGAGHVVGLLLFYAVSLVIPGSLLQRVHHDGKHPATVQARRGAALAAVLGWILVMVGINTYFSGPPRIANRTAQVPSPVTKVPTQNVPASGQPVTVPAAETAAGTAPVPPAPLEAPPDSRPAVITTPTLTNAVVPPSASVASAGGAKEIENRAPVSVEKTEVATPTVEALPKVSETAPVGISKTATLPVSVTSAAPAVATVEPTPTTSTDAASVPAAVIEPPKVTAPTEPVRDTLISAPDPVATSEPTSTPEPAPPAVPTQVTPTPAVVVAPTPAAVRPNVAPGTRLIIRVIEPVTISKMTPYQTIRGVVNAAVTTGQGEIPEGTVAKLQLVPKEGSSKTAKRPDLELTLVGLTLQGEVIEVKTEALVASNVQKPAQADGPGAGQEVAGAAGQILAGDEGRKLAQGIGSLFGGSKSEKLRNIPVNALFEFTTQ